MKVETKLTTIDNPFDPFDQFDLWLAFDEQMNYYTTEMLSRVSYYSNELSDNDINLLNEQAIDDIIEADPFLMYKKVTRSR